MHIITGLVLTALLGRRGGSPGRRPPSAPGVIETAHSIPGRLRLRIASLAGDGPTGGALAARLGGLEGVESVDFAPVCGSLVICYRPGVVEPDVLFGAVVRLAGLEDAVANPGSCRIRYELGEAGEAVNRAVFERTGGMLDLWTALPLLFVAIGVRKLLGGKGSNPQTGMMLLWWAYLSLFPPGGRGDSE
jgi:hypothetical protein